MYRTSSVKGRGSDEAPQLRHTHCSYSVMANFWWVTQLREVQLSASRLGTVWKWILSRMFSWREAGALKDSPAGSAHSTTPVSVRGALQGQLSRSTDASNAPLFTIGVINLKKY